MDYRARELLEFTQRHHNWKNNDNAWGAYFASKAFELCDLFKDGEFESVDEMLQQLDIPAIPTTMLVAYVIVTSHAHQHLDYRPQFFDSVQAELESRNTGNVIEHLRTPEQPPSPVNMFEYD